MQVVAGDVPAGDIPKTLFQVLKYKRCLKIPGGPRLETPWEVKHHEHQHGYQNRQSCSGQKYAGKRFRQKRPGRLY